MVCNAGRTKHKAALDFTTEEIDQLWGVNLYGSFYSARCAARAFIKQGVKGSIVFTASMASYRPNKVLILPMVKDSRGADIATARSLGSIWRV